MNPRVSHWQRVIRSAVLWSWVYNFLRLGAGLLLIPLLMKAVTKEELGLYYIFLGLAQFAFVIDFGFSTTTGRFVGTTDRSRTARFRADKGRISRSS